MRSMLVPLVLWLAVAVLSVQAQPSAEEKKLIDRIRQLGGQVMELAQKDDRLEVSYLYVTGPLTEEHLTLLKGLKKLVHLNLRGLPVTDELAVHLKPLTGLVRLHLEKTKITDKGLENLKGLEQLEYLNLYGTEITDAGLTHLEGLKKLKNLYLWQTKVSDAGVAKLKQALPQTDINQGINPKAAEPKKEEDKKPEEKKDKA